MKRQGKAWRYYLSLAIATAMVAALLLPLMPKATSYAAEEGDKASVSQNDAQTDGEKTDGEKTDGEKKEDEEVGPPPMEMEGKDLAFVQGTDGKNYWYEGGVRQGTEEDKKCFKYDGTVRGREIYDAVTNSWYWLDAKYEGAAAVAKEVFMPYIYQNEADWKDNEEELEKNCQESNCRVSYKKGEKVEKVDLSGQVKDAILNGTGKWVRYDENGAMCKGWYTVKDKGVYFDSDGKTDQYGNTYYYDRKTGLMAKGVVVIDGDEYHFDEVTGVLIEE